MPVAARRAMRKVRRRTPGTSSAFFERNAADAGRSAPAARELDSGLDTFEYGRPEGALPFLL